MALCYWNGCHQIKDLFNFLRFLTSIRKINQIPSDYLNIVLELVLDPLPLPPNSFRNASLEPVTTFFHVWT
jgi:hypothetical protein